MFRSLVLLPLAPVQGVVWVAEQLQQQADQILLDPDSILAELDHWQHAVDTGMITEDEYLVYEEELLDRLDAIRELT
ncbi:MAG TPA: gas vesicle protein GvpG [Acidimicrobiales bacterium]|nr:gas vesicle protein GvpG [Acidimicrobiales bacterium]